MTLQAALDILGVGLLDPEDKVKKNYRSLALKNHPDRGGDGEVMKAINGAYDFMKQNKVRIDQIRRKHQRRGSGFGFVFTFDMDGSTATTATGWGWTQA